MNCPFCKKDTAFVRKERGLHGFPDWFIVECKNCHASGPILEGNTETEQAAIEAWQVAITITPATES